MKRGFRERKVALRYLLGLLALAVMLAGISQVRSSIKYADLTAWAARVELGRPVALKTALALKERFYSLNDSQECQSQVVKSFLSLQLITIDTVVINNDYSQWAAAMQDAETAIKRALLCLPTDGNIWLRLAMVRAAIAEQPHELAHYITLSQLYTPADSYVIIGRYNLYNRLSTQTLDMMREQWVADIRILCAASNRHLKLGLSPPSAIFARSISSIDAQCHLL